MIAFLIVLIANESRYWIPKTANRFIKILREVLVYLIFETVVCGAIIEFVNNAGFSRTKTEEPNLASLVACVHSVYAVILAPAMRTIHHLTFVYHSIGTEVSANQLLKR